MRRNIVLEDGIEEEGLCYDLDRAKNEGLVEEMTLTYFGRKIPITNEVFDAILDATNLAVNVGPGDAQAVELIVAYGYDYGCAEVAVPA